VRNADALYGLIEVEIAKRTSEAWIAIFDAAGIPCAPVQNVAQMLGHEQLRALGLLQTVPGSSVPLIGLPISFDGGRPVPRSASPALGQHTAEVLGT
jgi:formyl-CoA transferase